VQPLRQYPKHNPFKRLTAVLQDKPYKLIKNITQLKDPREEDRDLMLKALIKYSETYKGKDNRAKRKGGENSVKVVKEN
jgi:hypothetical protein